MVRFKDDSFAERADKSNTRWVVTGSRLFNEVCGHAHTETKITGPALVRSKAAPLQARFGSTLAFRCVLWVLCILCAKLGSRLSTLSGLSGRIANDQFHSKNRVPVFLGLAVEHFQQKLSCAPSLFFRILPNSSQ
jgi:hypothetical protein